MKKLLAVGVIILFLGLAIAPSTSSESSTVLGKSPRWEEEIHYYNPDTLTHMIGFPAGTPPYYWYSAKRLSQDELASYIGWNLTKVNVALSCDNGQTEVWAKLTIWGEGTENYPGSKIYEDDTLYFDTTGFHKIELDTPIAIDEHNEIWIGIEWEQTEDGVHIIYNDEGPSAPLKGCWESWDGGVTWNQLSDYGLDYNWAIGAIVEGEGTELIIGNITGPIGVNAEVKNIGNVPAYNVHYLMIVSGGIFDMIFRIASDTIPELAPGDKIPIYSDLMFGLGPITINITTSASNAYEDSIIKKAFIIGPFVFTKEY